MEVFDSEVAGYIELKFGPRWKYIAVVRAFIQNFLAVSFTDTIQADKIAMAASELLENAVKYAAGEETRVSVHVDKENKLITVAVTNSATPEAIASLKDTWAEAMEGDPLQAYIKRMQIAATRDDSKSQLGLVRIRYETGDKMLLDTEDNQVTITLVHENN